MTEIEKTIEKSTNIDESKKQEENNEKSADAPGIEIKAENSNSKKGIVLHGLTWVSHSTKLLALFNNLAATRMVQTSALHS